MTSRVPLVPSVPSRPRAGHTSRVPPGKGGYGGDFRRCVCTPRWSLLPSTSQDVQDDGRALHVRRHARDRSETTHMDAHGEPL
jgi:hypothetical protein